MIRNFIKTSWRNVRKNKIFSSIVILGLTIGFACCIIICLFVQYELSYDRFNTHADRIYRVTSDATGANGKTALAVTPFPWAPVMKKDYPEIADYVRLLRDQKSTMGQPGRESFNEDGMLFADSSFFKIFSYQIIEGERYTPLSTLNSIVLSQSAAVKYFGSADPIGKTLDVSAFGSSFTCKVTAIVKSDDVVSHFRFNELVSLQSLGDLSRMWSSHMFQTYLLLNPGVKASSLSGKFEGFVQKYITGNPLADGSQLIHLQPLTDIHLHSNMVGEIEANGDITYVYVFMGIGLFILLIGCFNYVNLSTARSLTRAREVGVRKVIGAERGQLFRQFIGESLIFALIALMLAICICETVLPAFNHYFNKNLNINLQNNYALLGVVGMLILFVGLLAGVYPALVLSAFKPADVLKGKLQKAHGAVNFRKLLVTIQFAISIALIAGTAIIGSQLHFLKSKDVGFNKNNVMIVALPPGVDTTTLKTFKEKLFQEPGLVSVAAGSTQPGINIPVNQVNDGSADLSKALSMEMLSVDFDFIKTMKMKIIAGRDFSADYPTDKTAGFIINEAAVSKLGWKDARQAIGHPFQWVLPNRVLKAGRIVGVVKNFNITPLRSDVQPLVIHYRPAGFKYVFIRFNQANAKQVISTVNAQFKAFYPKRELQYAMLDQTLSDLYSAEQTLGSIFTCFSSLAIFIGCIGILGLSLNSIQQRIKEIGIRRVLGGSVYNIVTTLVKEFLTPVFIAAIIATPFAWWAMNKWLQGFAYRIQISIWLFVVVAAGVALLSVLTVSFQSVKAAMMNPVKSLKTE